MIVAMFTLLTRRPLLAPCVLAAAALAVAMISQYGFGTHACHLCLLQRYPYVVVIMLCIAGIIVRYRSLILIGCALAFFTTAGIGAYHVAVEHGWVEASDACAASTTATGSLEELKQQIMNAPLVSCADVGASFAGISMPLWNVIYGVMAAAFTLYIRKIHYVQNR